jgi:hypothetical protein
MGPGNHVEVNTHIGDQQRAMDGSVTSDITSMPSLKDGGWADPIIP